MTDYSQLLDAIEQYYGSGSDQWVEFAKYGVASDNAESILSQIPGVNIVKNANGSIRSYNLNTSENIISNAEQAVNSNVDANIKSFDVPANTAIDAADKMTFKSGMAQAGNFVFGEVVPAIAAAGVGITLGKAIDKVLYSANPDFWDEHGMSTLNPDEWNNITSNDTASGRLFNMVFGLNPDDKTQAYIDQNALAYMALYMQNKGVFNSTITIEEGDKWAKSQSWYSDFTFPIKTYPSGAYAGICSVSNIVDYSMSYTFSDKVKAVQLNNGGNYLDKYVTYFCTNSTNKENINVTAIGKAVGNGESYVGPGMDHYIVNNKVIYYNKTSSISWNTTPDWSVYSSSINKDPQYTYGSEQEYTSSNTKLVHLLYLLLYGTAVESGITGITTQTGATVPDLSNATTVQEALDALKQQYPELFQNAVSQDVVQPDGTTKTYTYVPIAMPELDENGNPVSSPSTQANPQVNPATATEPLLKLITKLIQKEPPVNPPDTGSGDTPVVVIPTGSANALYSIYNPTQAQLNSFGAWLWSSNFVDQLLKLFNDPMQAIIGLHKVFATPSISGTGNIKVGYIDSGVSSNIVGDQYTTVDCGSISLSEYFRNVFDYEPYTKVHLYLPFIGIVPLSVGEVMRSIIHVVYHVDVLTGACLAEVKITRDAAGGTLFQYSGNAAVQYPISSGSYLGIISGIMSIAGGIAGTIATGGAAMPVLLGAGASVSRMHTDISHSGSFSGNAGAMGIKKPYLIIDRPQTALAENFQKYIGFPANYTTKLSNCSGFVKVLECHIENANATNSELTEIESLLKEGILL